MWIHGAVTDATSLCLRCIAHRSKAHKLFVLSSAAAEYYEASEGCRERVYIRAMMRTFKDNHCPIRVCHLQECCDGGIVELRHLQDVIRGKASFSDLQGM